MKKRLLVIVFPPVTSLCRANFSDVGGCSLEQISKWVQEQRAGYYKSGVTIDGAVYPVASYKLTSGEFVDVHALEVSNIGINDDLKCQ